MTQAKRKPGEVAASAELGSQNPTKEFVMNNDTDSRYSAKVKISPVESAMKDLEQEIYDLLQMAKCAIQVRDSFFEPVYPGTDTDYRTLKVLKEDIETLFFATSNVFERSNRLMKRFYEAYKAGHQP